MTAYIGSNCEIHYGEPHLLSDDEVESLQREGVLATPREGRQSLFPVGRVDTQLVVDHLGFTEFIVISSLTYVFNQGQIQSYQVNPSAYPSGCGWILDALYGGYNVSGLPSSIQYSAIGNFTSTCAIPPFFARAAGVANSLAFGVGGGTGSCAASGDLPLGSTATCYISAS
ncbi:MAG: hypothetical protein GEU80_16050 [Dehalococcoidia bacterium]|nr:hypothetical protein [Dehalococcoidia bacterium]